MSSADPAQVLQSEADALVHTLEVAYRGLTATRYLSAAGVVVLLYDHILMVGEEKRLIWAARNSWSKLLFLVNRYVVPLCLIVSMHSLSGLSTAGLSTTFCRTWLSTAGFLAVATLATANVFVVHRIYVLWGRNRRVLKALVAGFCIVYFATIVATGVAVSNSFLNISYLPLARSCIISKRPSDYVATFALPLAFDVFLFIMTCWNAFDRPRSMQTRLVKQLYLDGAIYFIALTSLRLMNIIIVAVADVPFIQLGVYFIWSMITVLINRMLITISGAEADEDQGAYDLSGRETPFEQHDNDNDNDNSLPFELDEFHYNDFMEPDWKGGGGGGKSSRRSSRRSIDGRRWQRLL